MRKPKSNKGKKGQSTKVARAAKDVDTAPMDHTGKPEPSGPSVWQPGQDPLQEGEALDYDPTAYDSLHCLALDYPCLSFDVLKDDKGGPRSSFPHSLYFVAATQADEPRKNYVAFVRLDNLQQGKHGKKAAEEDDMSESSDDDEEEGGPPVLHARMLALPRGSNRIRAMPQKPGVVAVMDESGTGRIIDGTPQLLELSALRSDSPSSQTKQARPTVLHEVKHAQEGFAVDWSGTTPGRLATGDNSSAIHVWEPSSSGAPSWTVSKYKSHATSVEDIQWSPVEETVFASCSSDRTVRIWDTRTRGASQLSVVAHDADVNVISWNADTDYMLASGGDDGALKVWDLRTFAQGQPVASLAHHKAAITSVEWCPSESSMLATTGADGQLCVWDLALERDPEEEMQLAGAKNAKAPEDLPPQLLFVHGGQEDMKEMHWHPQIPGMMLSTAADGFNVFKPYNVG